MKKEMSEAKDPSIKLFGRTIKLPEIPSEAAELEGGLDDSARSTNAPIDDGLGQGRCCSPSSLAERSDLDRGGADHDSSKDLLEGTNEGSTEEDELLMSNELNDPNGMKENSKALSVDDIAAGMRAEEELNESSESQDKAPKKPDKILPCPRCNSMDTKFCYYNNYNVNQPRHFCKNCHRYWTAGGTMRNVPVGAGRRKNKHSASQYRHLTVLETLQNGREDVADGIHPTLKPNGSSFASCSDTPLCESMASVLNIAEKAVHDISGNGFHGPEGPRISRPYDNHSAGSTVATGSSKDETSNNRVADDLVPDSNTIPPHIACFPGAPWPYSWNAIQINSPVPPAAYCPPGFSVPFYPSAPYWACTIQGTWNVPLRNSLPASQIDTNPNSGSNSPTLGKHSRDDSLTKLANSDRDEPRKESVSEKCLWVPKTLRIDDPEEAAKSSIWETLGIRNDQVDSAVGDGLLKAFQSKGDEKASLLEASPLLQANPAALSRSLGFQESS